jgi:hypothetical protein
MLPTLLFVIFLIVIGVLVYYVYQEENEITRKVKEEVTPGLNAKYVGDKSYSNEIEPELLTLLTGRLGQLVQLKNIVSGEFYGVNGQIFTYVCHIRKNNRVHTLRQTLLAVKTNSISDSPKFLIRPPELMDELKKMVGYEFVQLPAAGNLAIQVHQEGVDDQLVFQNVPAETWQKMQEHSLTATHDGHWFIIYQYDHRLDPTLEAYQQFLKRAVEVYHTLLTGKSAKEK